MRIKLFVVLVIMAFHLNPLSAQKDIQLSWQKVRALPPPVGEKVQYGVAGALTGISHNHLIVAGGANFGDSLPWHGGKKTYHDEIYILDPVSGNWDQPPARLPGGMAYSACVTYDNRLLCLGGEDASGPLTRVLSIEYVSGKVLIRELSQLPQPVTAGDAALIGSTVYLAGGSGKNGALDSFYACDLKQSPLKWISLPLLPRPLSNAVVVSQSDGTEPCIYVIGGRNKTGITSTFYPEILKYSPSHARWSKAGEIKLPGAEITGLSAGTGAAIGGKYILLFSGDAGIVFNRTERLLDAIAKTGDEKGKQKLIMEKNAGLENHPGFLREVWAYNTFSGELQIVGQTPGPGQVTTKAVSYGQAVFIPSGEIRPGVRTPEVSKVLVTVKDQN